LFSFHNESSSCVDDSFPLKNKASSLEKKPIGDPKYMMKRDFNYKGHTVHTGKQKCYAPCIPCDYLTTYSTL
jgi:hypothetical protein